MAAAATLSWAAALLVVGPSVERELLLGMVGPLLATTASWAVAERTYRLRPEALTRVMTAAFGVKILFFGAYVALMLRVVGLRLAPFAASFFSYFIGLYLIEALYFRRLFR